MPEIPRSERKMQNRVIQLFTGPGGLGYDYLGEWNKRENNRALKQSMRQEPIPEDAIDLFRMEH